MLFEFLAAAGCRISAAFYTTRCWIFAIHIFCPSNRSAIVIVPPNGWPPSLQPPSKVSSCFPDYSFGIFGVIKRKGATLIFGTLCRGHAKRVPTQRFTIYHFLFAGMNIICRIDSSGQIDTFWWKLDGRMGAVFAPETCHTLFINYELGKTRAFRHFDVSRIYCMNN